MLRKTSVSGKAIALAGNGSGSGLQITLTRSVPFSISSGGELLAQKSGKIRTGQSQTRNRHGCSERTDGGLHCSNFGGRSAHFVFDIKQQELVQVCRIFKSGLAGVPPRILVPKTNCR